MALFYRLLFVLSLCILSFCNEAIETDIIACVFGGSTSIGGGVPMTSSDLIWHAKAADMFEALTGRPMQVLNFARGATDAGFYSTCFDRFEPSRCNLVLLEFAINGGNVDELVSIAKQKSSAPVVLVTQFSCSRASVGGDDAVQKGPEFEEFRAVARKHQLLNIEMDLWTSFRFGNPCENVTRRILFKEDAHHLSDAGHAALGELVGKKLAESYPLLFHSPKHRHHGLTHKHANDDIFCAASGEMLGSPEHDLANTFVSNGWVYDTDVPGRRDKACWLTTQPGATLSSIQKFDAFSRVEMFIQFSNKLQGVIHVGCDAGEIGKVNTTWEKPWTLIQRHIFKNDNSSFACAGKLHIAATNLGDTKDAHIETKVCGVVVKV